MENFIFSNQTFNIADPTTVVLTIEKAFSWGKVDTEKARKKKFSVTFIAKQVLHCNTHDPIDYTSYSKSNQNVSG